MNHRRILVALAAALLLAACQRTVFENPPATADQCDPQLVGAWLSVGEDKDDIGEMRVDIDADCRLQSIEQRNDGIRTSEITSLGTAKLRGDRVLWVNAEWAHRSYEIHSGPLDRPGDVYLYGYRIKRSDRLELYPVKHRALAERAVKNKMKADVLLEDGSLTVRPRGDVESQRKQLPRNTLFDRSEPLRFVRAPAARSVEPEQ